MSDLEPQSAAQGRPIVTGPSVTPGHLQAQSLVAIVHLTGHLPGQDPNTPDQFIVWHALQPTTVELSSEFLGHAPLFGAAWDPPAVHTLRAVSRVDGAHWAYAYTLADAIQAVKDVQG